MDFFLASFLRVVQVLLFPLWISFQPRVWGFVSVQVEFILMGGTFMSLSAEYRDYFVRNLHDALSGHSSADVYEAVRYSEQSRTKCIGLTIETRPDYCLPPHLTQMLSYGCTRCAQLQGTSLPGM